MINFLIKVFYSIATFIIVELAFSIAFFIRYLCYKSLYSKIDFLLFGVASFVFFVLSIYLNFG